MKKLIVITIIIMLLSAIFNCSNVTDPSERIIYPLKVGNSWEYTEDITLFNFQPDTFVISPTEYHYNINVEITRKDTLILERESYEDTVEAYCLYEQVIEDDSLLFDWENYYSNTANGLYQNSYYGFSWMLPKASDSGNYFFNGKYFNNIYEISRFLRQGLFNAPITADTIFTFRIPNKVLHYPIRVGIQWKLYKTNYGSGWGGYKKYVGWEFVSLPEGNFNCMKVQWLYGLHNNNEWGDRVACFDYINSSGLVKRSMLLTDVLYSDRNDVSIYVDVLYETVLTGYHLE